MSVVSLVTRKSEDSTGLNSKNTNVLYIYCLYFKIDLIATVWVGGEELDDIMLYVICSSTQIYSVSGPRRTYMNELHVDKKLRSNTWSIKGPCVLNNMVHLQTFFSLPPGDMKVAIYQQHHLLWRLEKTRAQNCDPLHEAIACSFL